LKRNNDELICTITAIVMMTIDVVTIYLYLVVSKKSMGRDYRYHLHDLLN